ncbi:MAG: hypothetical protein ACLUAH_10230 [Clostridium perfringens]
MLLCKKKGLNPGEITEKTVKNYIKTICEQSDGRLSVNDFKHDPTKVGSKYEFNPKIHTLLITLMATDYFDGRHNDRRLSTRSDLYLQLITNINRFLSDYDKKIIKSNPTYVNAMLEMHLTEHINHQLSSLLRTMYHSDPVLRYQFMIEFLSSITNLRKWMDRMDCNAMSTRMVYAHKLDDLKDALYQKGLFESIDLDEFMIKFLALRMHNTEYEYISDDEELSIPAMYLATKLFNITIKEDNEIKQLIDGVDNFISNEERYNEIINKAKNILDLDKPHEMKVYEDLKKLTAIQYLKSEVSPDDYERTIRFIESCIAKDKWDILKIFASMGRETITQEQISKIMAIKDHSEFSEIPEK